MAYGGLATKVFNHRIEFLLLLDCFVVFACIQTFTDSHGMVVKLEDVALKLLHIAKQSLHLGLQWPELIRMVLSRATE